MVIRGSLCGNRKEQACEVVPWSSEVLYVEIGKNKLVKLS